MLLLTSILIWLFSHLTAQACKGGRSLGDKWFDGCQWCVCHTSGVICSSSDCSVLNARLPPCIGAGSRWWDGCYQCTCHEHGIDCWADPACVLLIGSFRTENTHNLTRGSCTQPQSERCICGVDGVPSCTADAIDRNAQEAVTVYLQATTIRDHAQPFHIPPSPLEKRRNMDDELPDKNSEDNIIDEDIDVFQVLAGNPKFKRLSLRHDRRRQNLHRLRETGRRRSGLYNRRRNASRKNKARKQFRRHTLNNKKPKHARVQMTDSDVIRDKDWAQLDNGNNGVWSLLDGESPAESLREVIPVKDKGGVHNSERNPNIKQISDIQSDAPSENTNIPSLSGRTELPPSLLVTTDNRCRWGQRWYGGGLRCFCDSNASVTCGDPSFVASSIDGFSLERVECEQGHSWEVPENCSFCTCQVSGLVLCRQLEGCPQSYYPKVSEGNMKQAFGLNNNQDSEDQHTLVEIPTGSGDEDSEKETDVDNSLRLAAGRLTSKTDDKKARRLTVVKVVECDPGRSWLDGCRRCECTRRGKKRCDDSWCLKARPHPSKQFILGKGKPSRPNKTSKDTDNNKTNRPTLRPIIIPPSSFSSGRTGPVVPAFREPPKKKCGRFKVGERYWSDCNLCLCTQSGPRCTAVNC